MNKILIKEPASFPVLSLKDFLDNQEF